MRFVQLNLSKQAGLWDANMSKPLIAVTDSPFPSLDPVRAALARLDPEIRLAKSTSVEDILAVARDSDAIVVCYAKPQPSAGAERGTAGLSGEGMTCVEFS